MLGGMRQSPEGRGAFEQGFEGAAGVSCLYLGEGCFKDLHVHRAAMMWLGGEVAEHITGAGPLESSGDRVINQAQSQLL